MMFFTRKATLPCVVAGCTAHADHELWESGSTSHSVFSICGRHSDDFESGARLATSPDPTFALLYEVAYEGVEPKRALRSDAIVTQHRRVARVLQTFTHAA